MWRSHTHCMCCTPAAAAAQGVGGPCCARILTNWWAGSERGTYWGMWNIAHNLGGFIAPIIAGGFAKAMGWQWGMWAPGIIGSVVGLFVLFACRWGGVEGGAAWWVE